LVGEPEHHGADEDSPQSRRRRRANLTYDEIARAADAVLQRGDRVVIEAVREQLGGGAPRTVQLALRKWRHELPTRLKASPTTSLAADARSAFEAVWNAAQAAAIGALSSASSERCPEEALQGTRHLAATAQGAVGLGRSGRERETEHSAPVTPSALAAIAAERDEANQRCRAAERQAAILRLELSNARGLLTLERRRKARTDESRHAASPVR